jgi:anti-sigma regulatory factor (Ser/Thr protein kinase)
MRDDAELLTSELVTNSVRHGRGTVTVAIECDGHQLAVAVGDDSPDPPRIVDPGADGVGGRGIRIVSRIAAAWGWRPRGDGSGKVVWFRVDP